MLSIVTFGYVGVSSAGREISEEEGNYLPTPSSTMLRLRCAAEGCVDIVVRLFQMTISYRMLGLRTDSCS